MKNMLAIFFMALVINSFGQVREEKKIKINPSFMVATGGTLLFTYGVSNIIYPSQSSPFQNQKIPRWIEPTKGFLFFFGATLTIQGLWSSSKETNFMIRDHSQNSPGFSLFSCY